MRLRISREHGGTVLVALSLSIVLGAALASYLKLVQYQNDSVMRSGYWNSALPVAEAGIEDGLQQLNFVADGDRATHGWTLQNSAYTISRTLGDNRYEVSIDSVSQPTITSIGYVKDPLSGAEVKRTVQVTTTRYGSGLRGLITKQGISMNGNTRIDSFDSTDPNYSTNGQYDASKAHDLGFAGAVAGSIVASGDGVFGSVATGPTGSVSGNVGDTSWLASNSGIQPGHYTKDLNLSFPDAAVPFSGGALTPLNNQTVTVTNYTYLTSQTTSTTYPSPVPASGVTTNWQSVTTVGKPFSWSGTLITNTAAMSSTLLPSLGTYIGNVVSRIVVSGNGNNLLSTLYYDYTGITGYTYYTQTYTYNTTTTNSTTQTSTYSYVTDSGNYQLSSLSLSGQNEYLVRGDTVLYVSGDFSMSGQSQITILPGASLTVYVGGNASLSGNGVLNLNNNASKYSFYGLPGCTSITLSGNAAFTGSIYAPEAGLTMNGGGNNTYDCVGAVVVNRATLNGHFQFHYDENLARNAGRVQYKVALWSEI